MINFIKKKDPAKKTTLFPIQKPQKPITKLL